LNPVVSSSVTSKSLNPGYMSSSNSVLSLGLGESVPELNDG
jgi:hypothetical protein